MQARQEVPPPRPKHMADDPEILLGLPIVDVSSHIFAAGFFVSPGKWRHMTRVSNEYVLIFVKTGVLHIEEEGELFAVRPGETLLLRPNRQHRGTSDEAEGLTYFWLHFHVREGEAPVADGTPLPLPRRTLVSRPEYLETLFRHYIADSAAGQMNPRSGALLISLILSEISAPASSANRTTAAATLANRASSYLRAHIHDPLTTSSIAAALGCNPQYLSRVFHRTYRRTLTYAIHEARLESAKHALINSGMNVAEIARFCGYALPGYFIRVFRRSIGMTPGAFRRLYGRIDVNN